MGYSQSTYISLSPAQKQEIKVEAQNRINKGREFQAQRSNQAQLYESCVRSDNVYEMAEFEVKPEGFEEFCDAYVKFFQQNPQFILMTLLHETGSFKLTSFSQYATMADYHNAKSLQEDEVFKPSRLQLVSAKSTLVSSLFGSIKHELIAQSPFAPMNITPHIHQNGYSYFLVKNPKHQAGTQLHLFGHNSGRQYLEFCGCFVSYSSGTSGEIFELWRAYDNAIAQEALFAVAGLKSDGHTLMQTSDVILRSKTVTLCRSLSGIAVPVAQPVQQQQQQQVPVQQGVVVQGVAAPYYQPQTL